MIEYPKINSIFKRDTTGKIFLIGQYSQPEFEYLKNNIWLFTEKIDGTNIRVIYNPIYDQLFYCGKTERAQIPTPLLAKLQKTILLGKMKEIFPDGGCLYGEGYGKGIQSGGNYSQEQDFILFDIRVRDFWLLEKDVSDVANKLGLKVVPSIGCGTLDEMVSKTAGGFNSELGNCIAEGIVAKPITPLFDRQGKRIITKVKHKDFVGTLDGVWKPRKEVE